ncbi:MAG: flagellar basal body rod C-terminal domain-containing protein [Rickettsiales bacterium]
MSISTALSGLYASEQRLANAANNLANSDSSNYKATDIAQSTDASGGVNTRVVLRNPATVQVADNNSPTGVSERPNVSPERELVDANVASYTFKANLKVLKVAEDINKTLLDIQA